MLAQTTPTLIETTGLRKPDSHLSWPLAILGCICFLLEAFVLNFTFSPFNKLFSGLGISLPLLTQLFLPPHKWLVSALCFGAAALTIAKTLVQLRGTQLKLANLYLIFVGAILWPLAVFAMYLPLFELIYKLSSR